MILQLYLMLCSHFEYCVRFWSPQYKKIVKIFESTKRKAIKLEGMFYQRRLRTLGLFSFKKRRLRLYSTVLYKFQSLLPGNMVTSAGETQTFTRACSLGKIYLHWRWSNTRAAFLQRLLMPQNLSVFRRHLNNALSNMHQLWISPELVRQLYNMTVVDLFKQNYSIPLHSSYEYHSKNLKSSRFPVIFVVWNF